MSCSHDPVPAMCVVLCVLPSVLCLQFQQCASCCVSCPPCSDSFLRGRLSHRTWTKLALPSTGLGSQKPHSRIFRPSRFHSKDCHALSHLSGPWYFIFKGEILLCSPNWLQTLKSVGFYLVSAGLQVCSTSCRQWHLLKLSILDLLVRGNG